MQRPRNVDFAASPTLAVGGRARSHPPTRRAAARTARGTAPGAVRLSGARRTPAAPRVRHARKLSAALLLIAGGILVTTTSTGTVTEAPPPPAPTATGPTFFFDDTHDALAATDLVAARPTARDTSAKPAEPAETLDAAGAATLASPPAASSLPFAARPPGTGTPAVSVDLVAPLDGAPSAPNAPGPAPSPAPSPTPIGDVANGAGVATEGGVRLETVVVGAGDTLSGILNEHGLSIERLSTLLGDETVASHLSGLEIGQTLSIERLADGTFHGLSAKIGRGTRVSIRNADDGFAVTAVELPVEKERVVTSGTIEQSLYLAAEQAELKQSTIMTLADIFQWELDFARDIRRGDHFAVVYDRLYREGEYIGDGDILAAEFERGGRLYRAIRHTSEDGTSGYYAPDGSSKRRTFLRHPVDIVRITSKFDPERLHPVLHQIRAHRGVDYGAPHGSPVRATADGVVRFSGVRGAYGNAVTLQHGERTETLYAHLSRISDKARIGARVRQGEVIGYVGRTGRVTGTHLHYEFRVDGKHVDPLTVELPAAASIAASERDALRERAEELVTQMRSVVPTDEEDGTVLAHDSATR